MPAEAAPVAHPATVPTIGPITGPDAAPTTRTGGPKDGPKLLEHILGWTLVVVLAMFLTQTGLI